MNHPHKTGLFLLSLCLFLFSENTLIAQSKEGSPNIVLILVDDLGLMDLGAYGGEAATPNIDKLANRGTIFTNYHTSPTCAPSRAMLLTGYDSHLTGISNLDIFTPPEHINEPGYEGILNEKVKTLGTRLKEKGYRTYVTGKWHLGHTETTLPNKRGFDRSFILDSSGADNYEHKAYLPIYSKPPWYEDGQAINLPEDYYSSRSLVDKMMEFMDEEPDKEKPFFSYIAFQAIHIPVQAPKEYIQKYEGVYDEGWDKLRAKRFEKAKELELVKADAELGPMLPSLEKWDNQTEEEKKYKAKSMAANAAMIEAMDFHIGRYLEYLEKKGLSDNTIFVVTSDNGPEALEPAAMPVVMEWWLKMVNYDRTYEKIGEKGSWSSIGPQFASAAAGPSAFFKFYSGEGGMRVPLIIAGKNIASGQKKHAFSYVTDVTPTLLDIINEVPTVIPFSGKSLYPLMQGETEQVHQPDEPIGMEVAGNAALFKGDLKIMKNGPPYGDTKWRMYNIKADPGETTDISAENPVLFKEMLGEYAAYAKEHKVLEMPPDYNTLGEVQRRLKVKVQKAVMPWLIGVGLLSAFFFYRRYSKKMTIQSAVSNEFIHQNNHLKMNPSSTIKETDAVEIQRIFDALQKNKSKLANTTAKERKVKLDKLHQVILKYRPQIKEALYNDYQKHPSEVDLMEIYPVVTEIKHTSSHLRSWMKPQHVGTPIGLMGSSAYYQYEPKGVVLIISPWNLPVDLTFVPLINAIAAGNAVILKPSENTPHASGLMKKIVAETFEPNEVALVEGGVATATALLDLPFNHIFFTGSPAVGKIVMTAAAKNLSSVTLELGGKSPTIVDESANIEMAARRISWGKFLNNGQVCLSPDYIFVHKNKKEAFIKAVKKYIKSYYSEDPAQETSYARIVNNNHHSRVTNYIKDAVEKGATIEVGGKSDATGNYLEPTVLSNLSKDSTIMQEEIFGPIMPILEFTNISEVIAAINAKEKPLALYIYSSNKKNIKNIIANTSAGGVCVNHNAVHYFNSHLPFGGVNNSGIGKGHGFFGFQAFSNAKGVLKQHIPNALELMLPPYNTNLKQMLINLTVKYF